MCKLRHCSYSGNTRLSSGDKILSYVFVFNKGVFKEMTSVTSVVLRSPYVCHGWRIKNSLQNLCGRSAFGRQRCENRKRLFVLILSGLSWLITVFSGGS